MYSLKPIVILMCAVLAARGTELSNALVRFVFDDATGGLSAIVRKDTGETVVRTLNRYSVLATAGDAVSTEAADVAVREPAPAGEIRFRCTNPALPDFVVIKHYWLENGNLRRELTFCNTGCVQRFVIAFTDSRFSQSLKERGYYFGAGYLGPYEPAPTPKGEMRVDQYVQTSKGMVLANRDRARGSYAHYRVKINDTVVYPWWQSTIGSYRENADRLYYLPDGWRMCLGTLDMAPDGGSIRYTDCFSYFQGDVFNFFSDVYGKDREVMADIQAMPHADCPWARDVFLVANFGCQNVLKYYSEMTEEGTLISTAHLSGQWGDYRVEKGTITDTGGFATLPELQEATRMRKSFSSRIKAMSYGITVAGASFSPILKEHPEWFRFKNRRGHEDVLFPNLLKNYQTMMNRPGCMEFMANHLFDNAREVGLDLVYLDEAQQQNAIDWGKMELMRDDHTVQLWWEMKRRSAAENMPLFFNGSGQPFADINYMEALQQLESARWRKFAGVALGLELFSQFVPESRISLIGQDTAENKIDAYNRMIALGWIPPVTMPYDPLAALRAAYEVGKTLPVQADYSPDWKCDFTVDVESYSVRRQQSGDVIVSFISRAGEYGEAKPLAVRVSLESLGLAAAGAVNVWAVKVRRCHHDKTEYALSDAERRGNFQKYGWVDNLATTAELIYTGAPRGNLEHEFRDVARDEMVQLVAVPASASIFAVDGKPQNYFFSGCRGVSFQAHGNGVTIRNNRDSVDVLLGDKRCMVENAMLDETPATSRPVDIGGVVFLCVHVPRGRHEIRWKSVPRAAVAGKRDFSAAVSSERKCIEVSGCPRETVFALVKNGLTALTGCSPLMLPEKYENGHYQIREAGNSAGWAQTLELGGGRRTSVVFEKVPGLPKQIEMTPCERTLASGVRLLRAATHRSYSAPPRIYQENLQPCHVWAKPDTLELHAGNTRREDSLDSRHYAGFELQGARQIRLKYENTYCNAVCNWGEKHHVWGNGNPQLDFVGFVVDYRIDGKYACRVDFSTGIFNLQMANACPEWGTRRAPERHVSLGDLVNNAPTAEFSLDIARFAPRGWDGTAFFSVGATHVLSSRGQTVTLLEFNNENAGDFISVYDPAVPNMVERKIPSVLAVPLLRAGTAVSADIHACAGWARIDGLQGMPNAPLPVPEQPTAVAIAYDATWLHVLVQAKDTGRRPDVTNEKPYENDDVEFYVETSGGELVQVVADAAGRVFVKSPLGEIPPEQHGVKATATLCDSGGFTLLLQIPWALLEVKQPAAGMAFKANICRIRRCVPVEKSTWGPVERLFGETEKFGTLQLGRPIPGIGRFEDFDAAGPDQK